MLIKEYIEHPNAGADVVSLPATTNHGLVNEINSPLLPAREDNHVGAVLARPLQNDAQFASCYQCLGCMLFLCSPGIFYWIVLAAIARAGCPLLFVTNKTSGTLMFDHPYASTRYDRLGHAFRVSPVLTPNFNHVGPNESISFRLDGSLAPYAFAVVYNSTEKQDLTDYPLEFLLTKCSAFGYRSAVRAYGQDALGCTYYAQPTFRPPIFGNPSCNFDFFNDCPPVIAEEKNLRGYQADRKLTAKSNNFT